MEKCAGTYWDNPFLTNLFKGRINGHKVRGRSRKVYLEEIIRQAGCNLYKDMKRLAISREEWRTTFATTRQSL